MENIRTKLIFLVCGLFIFVGVLIYLPLSKILPKKVTSQILKRDAEIAEYLSNKAKNLLLLDDKVALSLLLHDNVDRLDDAQYLFVQGQDGEIVSHTFHKGFPRGLLLLSGAKQYSGYKIKKFLNKGRVIYDIAVPILEGEMGTLHLGVSLESGKKDIAEIARINYYVAVVIFLGLSLCIFALALAFNKLSLRLKEKIQEVKKLNTIEERNRIALELHDGCAQDMANIIKRIELSERLFSIDHNAALKELNDLKRNTKEVLDKTRQVIFDLKSSEDINFNLEDQLTNYVTRYKKEHGIDVKLDVSSPLDNIQPERSKSIFYIIREALINAGKHSQAKNVELKVKKDGRDNLLIEIRDDGKGFDAGERGLYATDKKNWGLIGMRQRANSLGGTLGIESGHEQGTRVLVNIPLT